MSSVANLTESLLSGASYDVLDIFYSEVPRCIGGRGRKKRPAVRTAAGYINPACPGGFPTRQYSGQRSEEKALECYQRSCRRTRQQIRTFFDAHIRGRSARFVTLTFAELPQSDAAARRSLSACFSRLSEREGHKIEWLAVPEYGSENGRLHYHCLASFGFYSNEEFAAAFWKNGFVKIERVKALRGQTKENAPLDYVLKYIGKDFGKTKPYKRRWLHSRGGTRQKLTVNLMVSSAEVMPYLSQLSAHGWLLNRRRRFENTAIGCVQCWQLIRRKKIDGFDLPFGSWFCYFASLKTIRGYNLFAESRRVEIARAAEPEPLPPGLDWLKSEEVVSLYYTFICDARRYMRLRDYYFSLIWKEWEKIRHEVIMQGGSLPVMYERLCRERRIESFEEFLLKTFYAHIPISSSRRAV